MSMNWEPQRFDPDYAAMADEKDVLDFWVGLKNGLLMTIPFWLLIAAGLAYAIHKYHAAVR